jgi:nicotinamidase/pyrazinamidase
MAIDRIFVDVDVQNDFCEETGALYVAGAPNDMFRALTRYAVSAGVPILGSVDSHAWDAWEFASSGRLGPGGERPEFPDHCVKGTAGWLKVEGTLPRRFRFVPDVPDGPREGPDAWIDGLVDEVARGATQGVYFEKEVYSLFANPLAARFIARLVERTAERPTFFVYGVATDYCVKAAALGLAQRGYQTVLLTDAVAGITPAGTEAALDEMTEAGVTLATAAELLSRNTTVACLLRRSQRR